MFAVLTRFAVCLLLLLALTGLHWIWGHNGQSLTQFFELLIYYSAAGFVLGGYLFTSYYAGQDVDRFVKWDFPHWLQPKEAVVAGRSMMFVGGALMLAALSLMWAAYSIVTL
ncbi:hypothetical protein [Motilimonas eburnea]|uniref:hypothetical protein n=1 Tax=Motilimonas eburnea TaxID=1737488 RepID=UPI001E5CDC08|nr:hypothetical protein [Motilimonas eburnea]MCE2572657.1 hypothetical protein [Motilimonas eburnea]